MDAGPDTEAPHRRRTGQTWMDVALSVSAVTISLISLLLGIGNGDAMKQLVAANSWPFVSIGISNRDEQRGPVLQIVAQNKGIGPAKIEALEVFYKGHAAPNARALIHAMLGPQADGVREPYQGATFVGDVLSSKEIVTVLSVQDESVGAANLGKLAAEAQNIEFRVCYCSVFNECWISDRTSGLAPPRPQKTCRPPKTPFTL
jgi:hypothetical protein